MPKGPDNCAIHVDAVHHGGILIDRDGSHGPTKICAIDQKPQHNHQSDGPDHDHDLCDVDHHTEKGNPRLHIQEKIAVVEPDLGTKQQKRSALEEERDSQR